MCMRVCLCECAPKPNFWFAQKCRFAPGAHECRVCGCHILFCRAGSNDAYTSDR